MSPSACLPSIHVWQGSLRQAGSGCEAANFHECSKSKSWLKTQQPAGWGNGETLQEEAAKPQPRLTVQAVLGFPFLQHVSTEPFSFQIAFILCQVQPSSFSASALWVQEKEIDDFYVLMCAEGNGHILNMQKTWGSCSIPFLVRICLRWEEYLRFNCLVASPEFRVTYFLLVITAQINPLHPVQIIAMTCVQSGVRGSPAADVVCARQLVLHLPGKCGVELHEVPVAQLQACGPLCPPCCHPCWGRGSVSARLSCSFWTSVKRSM